MGRSQASRHQQVAGPHHASPEPVSGKASEILSVPNTNLKRSSLLQTREASTVQYQKDKDKKGENGSKDQVEWNLIETKQETKKIFHSSNKVFSV